MRHMLRSPRHFMLLAVKTDEGKFNFRTVSIRPDYFFLTQIERLSDSYALLFCLFTKAVYFFVIFMIEV